MIGSFEELRRLKPDVTDFTENGHCSRCGSCCTDFLPVSREEIERIRAYVKKHNLKEHVTVVMQSPGMDMTCPFRDNVKKRCDIYEIRPEICRCFQCDQDMEHINTNKAVFYQKNHVVSMRGVFFGNERSNHMARLIALALRME